ncbi:MAG: hypothetical protein Q8Q35_01920 [Nanoarchaeota archaeon]|nr:hypothetical protein [Nanoarchaeota archaeon]
MKLKYLIIFVLLLLPIASACGGVPLEYTGEAVSTNSPHGEATTSYDSEGYLQDDVGNSLIDQIEITQPLAEKIGAHYISSISSEYEVRDIVLMYEHGIVEWKINYLLGDNVYPVNVDAITGNIYGQGCMGGPKNSKIVMYYNEDDYPTFTAAAIMEKADYYTEGIQLPLMIGFIILIIVAGGYYLKK